MEWNRSRHDPLEKFQLDDAITRSIRDAEAAAPPTDYSPRSLPKATPVLVSTHDVLADIDTVYNTNATAPETVYDQDIIFSENVERSAILSLNFHLQTVIFTFLDPCSLLRLAIASPLFSHSTSTNTIWKRLFTLSRYYMQPKILGSHSLEVSVDY